jgi:hypothetical protein
VLCSEGQVHCPSVQGSHSVAGTAALSGNTLATRALAGRDWWLHRADPLLRSTQDLLGFLQQALTIQRVHRQREVVSVQRAATKQMVSPCLGRMVPSQTERSLGQTVHEHHPAEGCTTPGREDKEETMFTVSLPAGCRQVLLCVCVCVCLLCVPYTNLDISLT